MKASHHGNVTCLSPGNNRVDHFNNARRFAHVYYLIDLYQNETAAVATIYRLCLRGMFIHDY